MASDKQGMEVGQRKGGRRGGRGATRARPAPQVGGSGRAVDYRRLRNPFPPVPAFSEDRVQAMHQTSLRVLEELGMKVLLPEAVEIYRKAGARVDDDEQMVFIGRDMVEAALATAPKSITMQGLAADGSRDQIFELGTLVNQAGAGCPHSVDAIRGRRPGTIEDFNELMKLNQSFDVLHIMGPAVEPQDAPNHVRHYEMLRAQFVNSDKVPFLFSRGKPQVEQGFELLAQWKGLSDESLRRDPHIYTIINTNSPRMLDVPMAQGLIDFARFGQMSIVTPFCLMGAMAPATVAGALVLSHAEALAAIVLTQLTNPGAPVCYGAFASNVDMKSGAPAFGTPEHVQANLGAGQLARLIGLPWRCASGSAANVNDAQAAHETQMAAWGCVLAGATVLIHGAGWIEGGLTFSYEKMMTDMEMLQIFAELCHEAPSDDDALAFEALSEIKPGGHFFGSDHTMKRFKDAFYDPLIADWSNIGTFTERGSRDSNARATEMWQERLRDFVSPVAGDARISGLDETIARMTEAGGAMPVS